MIPQRRRLTYALLLSLLLHALLLKLNFGGQGQWLQALGFDWIEFPDLRVLLEPAQVAPAEPAVSVAAAPASAPSRQAPTEQLPASGPTPTEFVFHPPLPPPAAEIAAEIGSKAESSPSTKAAPKKRANPKTNIATRSKVASGAARQK